VDEAESAADEALRVEADVDRMYDGTSSEDGDITALRGLGWG
jgi:hypothetical protein